MSALIPFSQPRSNWLDHPFTRRIGWRAANAVSNRWSRAVRDWRANRANTLSQRRSDIRTAPSRSLRGNQQTQRSMAPSIGSQIPTGGGDSRSFFRLIKPKLTNISKLELQNSILVNNSAFRVESNIGQQNYLVCGDYFTDGDINLQFTALSSTPSSKLVLKSVHGETLITNQENVNARITLYDIIARRDGATTVPNPGEAFRLGFADNGSGAAADYLVPGTSIYGNPRFTNWFKVLKTTQIILSPGAVHSHTVDYAPNKLFSHEVTSYTTPTSVGGLTMYTFIVFHGSPINDIGTQTQVSLSHIALDVVQKEEYKFVYAHTNLSTADVNQALPLAFTTAGATMQDDGVELPSNEA